jgi:transposase
LAKNDKIDAALTADCTAAIKKIHPPPDPRLAPFAGHLTMIEQIGEDIARAKTRLETCRDPHIRHYWQEEIARDERREKLELKQLAAAIRQHSDLAKRLALIASIEGIGLPTAVAILIRLPEIGSLTREQAAALVGLAPFDDDSGEYVGIRHIKGGRERLRTALYRAALPAAFRWNRHLIDLYRRLTAKGKLHKVALIACARKLLIYANIVVARGTPWVKTRAAAST